VWIDFLLWGVKKMWGDDIAWWALGDFDYGIPPCVGMT